MKDFSYHCLEDFLRSHPLDIDGLCDNDWGTEFPVKGREIEAAILFADIRNFANRTSQLTATETCIFLNYFASWISADVLKGRGGLIDKYIGDEIMIVFAREFGSTDPVRDALQTGRLMGQNDLFEFDLRIGIAYGPVTVGYVGSRLNYSCSVFGQPVALAKRCSDFRFEDPSDGEFSASICLPDSNWSTANEAMFSEQRDWVVKCQPTKLNVWNILQPQSPDLKGFGEVSVRAIVHCFFKGQHNPVENRTRTDLKRLKEAGHYRPRS